MCRSPALPLQSAPDFSPATATAVQPTAGTPVEVPAMTSPARHQEHGPTRSRLDRSLAQGTAWTVAMKAIGQSAAWLSTLVVARLLSPSDYGIFGMATLYLGLLQLLSEFGIGAAIVAQEEVDPEDASQLNTVAVSIGLAGAALLCATSPLVAWFFKTPRLVLVLIAMSGTFVISSLRTVPWALLQRDLRFKRLAIYDVIQSVVLAAASIALAAAGFGYWTLVLAALMSAVLSVALTLWHHPTPFARPNFGRVRDTLTLGGDVLVQRISWYGYSNADFLIAGRVLGQHALGSYTLAWTLANIPIDKLAGTILQVTPGVFARARSDVRELQRYLLRITEFLMLVIAPITVGMALVAPVFVHAILGLHWEPIIPALQVLSVYATVRVMMPLFSQVLLVQGLQRYATRVNVVLVIFMPPVFFFGSHWGITGISLGWVLVYPVIAVTLMRRALRSVELTARALFRASVWPTLLGCGVMAIVVLFVRLTVPHTWTAMEALPLEILSGAATYVSVLLRFHGTRMRDLLSVLRTMRGGAPSANPA